jgi:hypothetical protein
MECAYYLNFGRFQVDGTWNVPTTLTFVGCVLFGERQGLGVGVFACTQ